MLTEDLRKEWCFTRFQYYVSGRSNLILSNFYAAGILLGYAVETSYKQLLLELGTGTSNKILKSHSTRNLHAYLKAHYTSFVPSVSVDFLDYIDDHLHARYPIQRAQVINRLRNRFYTMNFSSLSHYDDLLWQLDLLNYSASSDYFSSIYFRAGTEVQSHNGAYFFHGNYLAYINLNTIIGYLTTHAVISTEISFLQSNQATLYDNPSIHLRPEGIANAGFSYRPNFASRFVYPAFNQQGTVTLKVPSFLTVNWPL